MTKRLRKKLNKMYRCQFIADKIGTEMRTCWVYYFKKHPNDLALVKKMLKRSERESNIKHGTYVSTLCHDVRTNYVCPSFNKNEAEKLIKWIENGDFFWYNSLRSKNFMGISRAVAIKAHDLPTKRRK